MGAQRLRGAQRSAQRLAGRVRKLKLPTHHVLPGPVDGANARYDADSAVDIPSDGALHAVSLFDTPARLELRWRAVPREDPRVFRELHAHLKADMPLLAGPVDIFVDGALTRSFPWQGGARGVRVRLGMGAEDRLKLARNVRYREETAGLLRGSRRLFTAIEVEIASAMDRDIDVELLERVPVAGDDKVDVSVIESNPPADEWKGEPNRERLKGGRLQRLPVPARGTATATLEYTMTMDGKLELQGGDRRG